MVVLDAIFTMMSSFNVFGTGATIIAVAFAGMMALAVARLTGGEILDDLAKMVFASICVMLSLTIFRGQGEQYPLLIIGVLVVISIFMKIGIIKIPRKV